MVDTPVDTSLTPDPVIQLRLGRDLPEWVGTFQLFLENRHLAQTNQLTLQPELPPPTFNPPSTEILPPLYI